MVVANRLWTDHLRPEEHHPEFFKLSTSIAGAIPPKFVNYNIRIAIIGDFSNVASKSLNTFIYESDRGNQVYFVDSVKATLKKLAYS